MTGFTPLDITNAGIYGFTKGIRLLLIALELAYVLFAFMLTRQVKIMNLNFKTNLSKVFTLAALFHFLASVAIFVFMVLSL